MISLRKALVDEIKKVLEIILDSDIKLDSFRTLSETKVYFQQVPENTTFPYLVYNLPSAYDDGEGHQLITLDIDGWDIPPDGDTMAIETLMAEMNAGLNKRIVTTEDFAVVFYLETKLALIDDDPDVKRRKYVYQVRLFERS